MPQIQILPSIPTFGSRLTEALGNAGVDVAQAFQQKSNKNAIQNLTSELADPNKTDLQKVGIITKLTQRLGPEASKSLMPFLSDLYTNSGRGGGQQGGQPPGSANMAGVPQGPTEAIDAQTQPQGVQNAPSPTGQTDEERSLRRQDLARRSAFPGGKGAENTLKLDLEEEKIALKRGAEERKYAHQEEEKLDALQKDIVSGYEAAEISESNLNAMERLKDSPKLIGPLGAYLSDIFGVPVSLASGADSEEFEKLVAQRGLNVASAYGLGRILATEFSNFLKTMPRLLNTKEGKERVIGTLRYFDNLAKARYGEYKKLLGQRKPGERVRDLELKLTESMKPYYDKFGQVLKYGDELVELKNPEGKKGKVRKSEVDEALKEGYSLAGE